MAKSLPKLTLKGIVRFSQSLVISKKERGCWMWTGAFTKNGYGLFWFGRRQYLAHRISYLLHFGNDPGPMLVCHKCDNKKCVRPAHFFLGTHADNHADMMNKGRHPQRGPKGEAHSKSKLKNGDIPKIRALIKAGERSKDIAPKFGVSPATIWQIKTKRTWSHIKGENDEI